jgi:RimJ/RimL family protein N-acetyltransferase
MLRPLQSGDEGDLFAVYADPAVMRYWSTPPWTDIEQARAMVATDATAMPSGEHLRLGLVEPASGHLLGSCTLFNFSRSNRRAEIGYALARSAWGRGLMHEALSALVAHGFGPLGLHRIEADIDPRNLASARSLERLGFRLEGVLRERWIVNGEVSDTGYYGLLQREWLAGEERGVPR